MFPMQHVRILALVKRTIQIHGYLNIRRFLSTMCTIRSLDVKNIQMTSTMCYSSIVENVVRRPTSLTERLLRKIGVIDVQKYRYIALAYTVYDRVMDQIDFPFFFKYFNMTDTLFSWFLVTELHVWMMMVRYMAEGKSGELIRNNIVAAMWEDTNARIEKLGEIRNKLKSQQVVDLSHQFNAALIGYDEGIQSDDKVLAGALWRRFFHLECNNPEHIETLVIYIRKQICLFDSLPAEEVLRKPILKLIDIKSICKLNR